eukprot:CAMPEP_0196147718 /NCGR_PEP_ID=MMETSP0910-20130528/26061_1 /TAXON_ID=49265 /ORGANISM="Thalassiosira rotula, Strain GSO102" /LENGTH=88 /DNA_ID=CAMNT_0041410205 /DNA_START=76 /DNA_END=342 /DNA_ORIENTATION=+
MPQYILNTAATFPKKMATLNNDRLLRSSNMTIIPRTNTIAYNNTPFFWDMNPFLRRVIPNAESCTTVNAAIWTDNLFDVNRQCTVAWN